MDFDNRRNLRTSPFWFLLRQVGTQENRASWVLLFQPPASRFPSPLSKWEACYSFTTSILCSVFSAIHCYTLIRCLRAFLTFLQPWLVDARPVALP